MHKKSHLKRSIFLWVSVLCISFTTFAQNPNQPYNVVMNIYDDPKTKMAFNRFTNNATGCGKVEIVVGETTNPNAFTNPFKRVDATCSQNNTVNKAVVTGLSPGTTYSFRVGGVNNIWSNIGTFTTAKDNKDPFSFIYITDTQVGSTEFGALKTRTDSVASNHDNAKFWLHCGDLTWDGSDLDEWKKYFTSQQAMFYHFPFAPTQGNHEEPASLNFSRHFHLNSTLFDSHESTYTFIYGDAQFFGINSEWYGNNLNTYIGHLSTWMHDRVNAHSDITWRIVYFHKSAYTAAGKLQHDYNTKQWRQAITPLLDSLNIDIVFFGHDHLYQVIGPVKDKQLVQGSVSNVQPVMQHDTINATGKSGGIFNVRKGSLYFCNNRFGTAPFYPFPFDSMPGINTDISNYPSFFTGMLGQKKNPTYSNVSVSTSKIIITTHEIVNGNSQFLDEIKVIKYCDSNTQDEVTYNSSQSFNNVTLSIGETLKITNNATVTFTNSVLRFYKDAKVVIEPGSKLILDNTTLKNSCQDIMWRGILVGGNELLPQKPETNQGVLELKNGAVIENARNAIATYTLNANGNIDWNTCGGIIRADNATFKNNRRSVEFLIYPSTANLIPQNLSYFKDCTFIVDDDNLFANNNATFNNHLTMWAVTGVKITNCKFYNHITNMPDRGKAIGTLDAGYIVNDDCSRFNYLLCTCAGISKPSVFKGFKTAIESTNSTKQYAISMDRCQFENNITGISLKGKESFRILEAYMSLSNNYHNFPTGLYLHNCTNYQVDDNNIYSNMSGKGIYVTGTIDDENKLYRNNIHHTSYGIYVGSDCKQQLCGFIHLQKQH